MVMGLRNGIHGSGNDTARHGVFEAFVYAMGDGNVRCNVLPRIDHFFYGLQHFYYPSYETWTFGMDGALELSVLQGFCISDAEVHHERVTTAQYSMTFIYPTLSTLERRYLSLPSTGETAT